MKAKSNAIARTTRNDVEHKTEVIAVLNQQLANLGDLFTQTKFAHWNVKGPHFIGLHKLFDELAEIVEDDVDDVAERITALGGIAMGTARMAAEASELDEFPTDLSEGMAVTVALADRYGAAGNSCRAAIDATDDLDDADTADLLTDVSRHLDKALYFLEAHKVK